MKKTISLLISAAVLCCFASSCEKDDNGSDKSVNAPIADYLYAIEYDDYDLEANISHSMKAETARPSSTRLHLKRASFPSHLTL